MQYNRSMKKACYLSNHVVSWRRQNYVKIKLWTSIIDTWEDLTLELDAWMNDKEAKVLTEMNATHNFIKIREAKCLGLMLEKIREEENSTFGSHSS